MKLTRERRYKLLQLFGDGKPHDWFSTIFLGVNYLKVRQSDFEELLRQAVIENALIKRCGLAPTVKDDSFQLTDKGDECLRVENIQRSSGSEYDYYKNFDRTQHGSHGLDHYAPLPKGFQERN